MKKITMLFITLLFITSCNREAEIVFEPTEQVMEQETLSLLTFNIQIFGKTKAGKPEVMDILADIIMQYDLIAIQEVRDASGESVPKLMEMLTPNYTYFLGPREGRSNSKEQYLFIWDSRKFDMIDSYVFPDEEDWFERNPLAVHFESYNDGVDFIVINNHIAPSGATEEIPRLINVAVDAKAYFQEDDIILLGDLNADGSYYNEEGLAFQFRDWDVLTKNELNTTVAKSNNTYDRIITNNYFSQDYADEVGVLYFKDYYDFESLTIEEKHVSDHYPVYIELYNGKDTD